MIGRVERGIACYGAISGGIVVSKPFGSQFPASR